MFPTFYQGASFDGVFEVNFEQGLMHYDLLEEYIV